MRMISPPADGPATPLGGTLVQLALAAFASGMSMRLCDPMLPRLAAEFGGSLGEVAPTVTAFALAYGLFALVNGPLGDRRGKLRVIAAAALVAALASLGCALAGTTTALVGARFVTGAACAAIIPLTLAWIGDSVDFAVRQRTLARFASASIAGLIAGQVLGGVLTDTLGWRAAFAVPTVLFAIAAALIGRRARLDGGAPTSAPLGVVAGYAALLRNRWARFLMIAVTVEGALAFGALAFVPAYLHGRVGLPLWQSGLVVAAYGVGGLAFSAQAGAIIARFGDARMAAAGGALLFAGFAGIAFATLWPAAVLGCAAAGFGFTMLHNTLQTQATQAHPTARGTAIAGFVLCLFTGQAVGVTLAASLGARGGWSMTFALFGALLAVLGLVVSRALARQRRLVAAGGSPSSTGAP